MESAVVSAIIGGIFSIIGIYIKHRLQRKTKLSPVNPAYNISPSKGYSSRNDIKKGLQLLLFDFVFLIGYTTIITTHGGFVDTVIGIFILGIIPVYGSYRILRGIFRFFTG